MNVNPLADRVRLERLRRKWSVRKAAALAGISNTYWGEFEDYRRPLTPTIADGVARAFDWPKNWPDQDAEPVGRSDLESRVERLERLAGLTPNDASGDRRAVLEREQREALAAIVPDSSEQRPSKPAKRPPRRRSHKA